MSLAKALCEVFIIMSNGWRYTVSDMILDFKHLVIVEKYSVSHQICTRLYCAFCSDYVNRTYWTRAMYFPYLPGCHLIGLLQLKRLTKVSIKRLIQTATNSIKAKGTCITIAIYCITVSQPYRPNIVPFYESQSEFHLCLWSLVCLIIR